MSFTKSVEAPGTASGVLVLGTGRSGTSAIVNSFTACGCLAGKPDELYPASPSNPLGHHEPLSVIETNEAALASFGRDWWADAPPVTEQEERREEIEPRLRAVLKSLIRAAEGAPVAIKEPRINSLLPLWAPVVDGVLHPVVALRDPIEVALSHGSRDGTSTAHALAAWEFQMMQVLDWLEGKTATIAPYATLLADADLATTIVVDATSHFRPALAEQVDPSRAPSVFRPDLRKEDSSRLAKEEYMTPRQIALWEFLRELPAGDNRVESPAALREPGGAAAAIMRVESERVRVRAENDRRGNELNVVKSRVAELDWQLSQAKEILAWKETLLAGAQESHRVVEERAASDREELARTRGELARAQAEIAELRGSASWRLTAPLRAARRRPGRRH
jgi:hypothetical protein